MSQATACTDRQTAMYVGTFTATLLKKTYRRYACERDWVIDRSTWALLKCLEHLVKPFSQASLAGQCLGQRPRCVSSTCLPAGNYTLFIVIDSRALAMSDVQLHNATVGLLCMLCICHYVCMIYGKSSMARRGGGGGGRGGRDQTCDEPRQVRIKVLGKPQCTIQKELGVIITIQHPFVGVPKLPVRQKWRQSSPGVTFVK